MVKFAEIPITIIEIQEIVEIPSRHPNYHKHGFHTLHCLFILRESLGLHRSGALSKK